MISLESPIKEIFNYLAIEVYDPKRGQINWGHDDKHILRMLAARRAYWADIVKDEPGLVGVELLLDLAILFHDLNRLKNLRGHGEADEKRRKNYATKLMKRFDITPSLSKRVNEIVAAQHLPDNPNEEPVLRLLRDLDKADMGAIGIYRMAATACDRGYGVFARARDFDPDVPAIEGDENLDSFAADICFCLEWFEKQEFAIRSNAIRQRVAHRFEFMRKFLEQLKIEHKELNLI